MYTLVAQQVSMVLKCRRSFTSGRYLSACVSNCTGKLESSAYGTIDETWATRFRATKVYGAQHDSTYMLHSSVVGTCLFRLKNKRQNGGGMGRGHKRFVS